MVIRFIWSAVIALALLISGAVPAQAAPGDDRGDGYLKSAVERLQATGGAWAVVRGGELSHVGVTGTDGEGRSVTPDTTYVIGSVSKPLLATAAVTAAEAGRLDLDAPVVDALPDLRRVKGAEAITARHLLAHTSGLPFGADELDLTGTDRTAAGVVAGLDVALTSRPGERYAYSSLGYLVLTAWVEAVTGRPLTALYADTPGIGDVTRTATAGKRGPWMPLLHTDIDPAGLGYGYAAMSVNQLAAFARASLGDRERLAAMTAVEPGGTQTLTGLGWRVDDGEDGRRVWHTGTVPGSFSAVYLMPERDLAVVFVVNRSGVLDEERLYAASAGLLSIASGGRADLPGWGWELPALVAAMLLVGVVAALVARRGGWLRWLGLALAALLVSGPLIAAAALGVPVRYGWLWAPELVIAMVVAGLSSAVMCYNMLRWRREDDQSAGAAQRQR